MPLSPGHQNRPRLGTVLSRRHWEDRRSNSTTSSLNSHDSVSQSTHDSFDPENEALASTALLKASTPHQGSRRSVDHESSPASPDLRNKTLSEGSDGNSDTADMSIEIGRGGRNGHRKTHDSRNDDAFALSSATLGDYPAAHPPANSTRNRSKPADNNSHLRNLRQSAQVRMASGVSQKENRDPVPQPFRSFKSSDLPTRVKRKTLGELNARASEIYDESLINQDRPTQTGPTARATRFSGSKAYLATHVPSYGGDMATDTADMNQSYILPDLPNLSQLMPATNQERITRGNQPSAYPAILQTPRGPVHKTIDAVPIPNDEKAIIVSLNSLQAKVNELEVSAVGFQRTIEDLKAKNLVLREERRDLRTENEKLRRENQKLRLSDGLLDEDRSDEQTASTQQSHPTQQQTDAVGQVNSEVLRLLNDRQQDELFSLTPRESVKQPRTARAQRSDVASQKPSSHRQSKAHHIAAAMGSKHSKKVTIDEDATKPVRPEGQDVQREKTSQNMTFLTTEAPPRSLFDLRNLLESERGVKKLKSAKENREATSNTDAGTAGPITNESTAEEALPQPKPSHKDARRRDSNPTTTAASNTSRRRRGASANVLEDENMTSAFLIPDITIAKPTIKTSRSADTAARQGKGDTVQLTEAAQHIVHSLSPHEAANCIICSRLTANDKNNNKAGTVKIQKPTPISSLPDPEATADYPDPTLIRPCQPPSLALACVLKEVTDQHSHLRVKLASAQKKYHGLDPKVGRKRRQRLDVQIRALMAKVEAVAGMVYRLWDVVEGLKGGNGSRGGDGDGDGDGDAGGDQAEMSWEEVEVTIMGLRDVITGSELGGGIDEDGEGEDSEDSGMEESRAAE